MAHLSIEDFQRCQIQQRAQRSYRRAPSWVWNDKLVRKVIAAQMAATAGLEYVPEDLDTMRKISDSIIADLKASPSHECNTLAEAADRIGLPAYYAALIYLTYRAGCDSVACATQLHISPPGVRQTLHRLRKTAERIGVA